MAKYVLFTADFDEKESKVDDYESLESLIDDLDGECCECGSRKKWIDELINNGYHYGEWHNYHLLTIGDEND